MVIRWNIKEKSGTNGLEKSPSPPDSAWIWTPGNLNSKFEKEIV